MDKIIAGKAWVGGDDILVHHIVAMSRWNMDKVDPEELGNWVMESADPEFEGIEGAFKSAGYSIIVAGKNFGGGGKSIEHPVIAVKGAGVKVVIAESFSRFNFHNSVNNGLPVFTCPGITKLASKGDMLSVNIESGLIKNESTGNTAVLTPMSQLAMDLIDAGGLIPYTKSKLGK